MLSNQQLKEFQQQLQQSKQELEERLNDSGNYDLRRSLEDSTGELSSYDNHPGDEGTELYEREKDLALSEHDRDEIRDIERALSAIEAGEYGKCEVCSKEIPLERLKAIPTTTYCVEHTPSQETSDNRPVEEEVLGPHLESLIMMTVTNRLHTMRRILGRMLPVMEHLNRHPILQIRQTITKICMSSPKKISDMSKIMKISLVSIYTVKR